MFPTPRLGKIDFNKVYEPREDTFVMLDALEADRERLLESQPRLCVEIGSGSGCVITFLGQLLAPLQPTCLAIDINPAACQGTVLTGRANGIAIDTVRASLTSGMRLEGAVDVLLFNPPYVPTEDLPMEEEKAMAGATEDQLLEAAWAGGPDGCFWIDRLLPRIHGLLSPKGCFIMIAVRENDPDGLRSRALSEWGLQSCLLLERRARNEHLVAIKFYKAD